MGDVYVYTSYIENRINLIVSRCYQLTGVKTKAVRQMCERVEILECTSIDCIESSAQFCRNLLLVATPKKILGRNNLALILFISNF